MSNPDTTIQLRSEDLDFIFTQVSNPGLDTRNVSGFANNLTPGRTFWGNADQPFLHLTPAQFEPQTKTQTSPNAVRTTSADGTTSLPNPRLISDVIGQQALDVAGDTISTPNPYGTNLFLMSFGQFFDHGLDFYARGGGPDLVPIADMNEQLAAAQLRLNGIRATQGLPPVQLDLTDNLLAQLEHDPQAFEFLIGSRAGRFDMQVDGSVAANPDGIPVMNNATGTVHLNRTSPFVDQSQSYGSAPEITYLLRESARTEAGDLIPDGHGGWIKTSRLLDGAAEVGPDGVARGSLPSYADILVNNGVSRDAIDRLLADVAGNRMTNFDAWVELKSLNGFVDFDELGPTHLILLGDKNDANASPVGPDGTSNPYFSLENLLSYHIAGDHRANENVALTAVHTVWHREHNFQVERIKGLHPEWSEEQVFQTAKIIQTAEYQRVVFTEFAQAMSGPIPGPSHGFSGYNPNVNPGISDEFAGAMYRVGHSMINETIPFTDSAGHTLDIPLFSAFLNPAMFDGKDPLTDGVGGAAAIIAGEVQVAHQRIDTQVVEVIHSELLGTPLDLYAANIERGREVGVATLNEFRRYVNDNGSLIQQAGQASNYAAALPAQVPSLAPYATWAEFGQHLRGTPAEQAELLALFKAVYGEGDIHVNDVDLFVGGLAEAPVGKSQMGSTFTWIFQEQLDRLQEGDRFYYFNQLKDAPLLLADIGSQHFSDIVMRNTGLDHLHYDIFKVSERVDLDPHERSRNLSAHPVTADKVLVIVGNALPNVITGTDGDDALYGEDGNDTLNGGLGLDALHGGAGDDVLNAGDGSQGVFAYGDDGNDTLRGNAGDDNLIGGAGDDYLIGGSGKDFLSGGLGDDWIVAGADPNMIDGGSGSDTVDFSGSTEGVNVDLRIALKPIPGLGGYAQGDLISGVENLVGSDFADVLIGNEGDNRLDGGRGNDLLNGGGGADRFAFAPGFGNDRIEDFDAEPAGGQDYLDISAFGVTADDFRGLVTITDVGTDALVTINGDPNQTILLAGIGNVATITQQDFVLSVPISSATPW
jgi:Animal haem peroxidase/RTX calcium-binding nonapeptide repeat (4 copies)